MDTLSEDLTEIWPPGQRPGAKPATRFDLPRQFYFNMTHMFFPDDFTNVRPHTKADLKDIENVIEEVKAHFDHTTLAPQYQYRRLVNGYRTFDLSRGMDYTLDLAFRDLTSGKEAVKRFQVSKPLGRVEFVPGVPYVTENSRITVLLPVEEHAVDAAMEFLLAYSATIMDRKEKTFLMLVLLYQAESANKGAEDVFHQVKGFATKTSSRYKNEDMKVAWVSIRLPPGGAKLGDSRALDFALVDLALKKVGLESLVLVLDVYANVTADFLNRVRMNTVPGFQVFSPVPFRQYNPKVAQSGGGLEVSKNGGHFDREEYRYVSFYGKDYVNARKQHQKHLPIVRVDNDIADLLTNPTYKKTTENIFSMFVRYGGDIHPMRATEMGLKIKYHAEEASSKDKCNLFIGSASQLGRLLISKKDQISELS